jgi:uncharacterized protein YggT (Ycf19 family)
MSCTLTIMVHRCCEPFLAFFKHLRIDVKHLNMRLPVKVLVFRVVEYSKCNVTCIGGSDEAIRI